jgi:hypothetical protein
MARFLGRTSGKQFDRGQIDTITLETPFWLNSQLIKTAVVEIDHINFGLNTKTKTLNAKKRTDFSTQDVEKFLALLDGEYVSPIDYVGRKQKFAIRIDCPIKGRFFGKEFILIFDLDYDRPSQIYTITLYPGWNKR